MLNIISFLICSVITQSLIGIAFLPNLLKIQNSVMTYDDVFHYISYFVSIFFVIRFVIVLPFVKILSLINEKLQNIFLIFIETIFFVLILVDGLVYSDQGIHIFDKVVLRAVTNPNANREFQFSSETFMTLAAIIISTLLFKYLILKFVNFVKNGTHISKHAFVLTIVTLLLCLGNTALRFEKYINKKGEIANYFPLYPIIKGSPGQEQLVVKYNYKVDEEKKVENKKNILFILAESLRGDYLSEGRMPKTWKLLKDKNCHVSKKHFSGGHTTEYGVFSSLYGLYGYHYNDFYKSKKSSYALDFLRAQGYFLLGSSASLLSTWNNAGFITNNFDEYKEFSGKDVHIDDVKMSKWTLLQLKKIIESKSSVFTFNFFNSTHHNYFYSKEFEIHRPVLDSKHNHFMPVGNVDEFRNKILNRYKNSVLYLDDIMSKYISSYLDIAGQDSIVMISGDHGEEFWEEGLLGHGKSSYINAKVNVPLAICNIEAIKPEHQFSSQVDMMPTLLNAIGANDNIIEKFNGFSYLSESFSERPYLVIVGPQFPYGRNKLGVVTQNFKFWLKKPSRDLHKVYKYRVTNLADENILDASAQDDFKTFQSSFSKDAYKFLSVKE